MNEWFRTLAGPGALTVFLIAVWQGILKLKEIRDTRARELEARADNRAESQDERDAEWNVKARRGIEAHLPWDNNAQLIINILLSETKQHRGLIHALQKQLGQPLTEFVDLPEKLGPPPPLFPDTSQTRKG